jgi:hypothetical protein
MFSLTSAAVPQPGDFWLLALSFSLKAKSGLPLALFVFRDDADHPHDTFAVDDLALVANLLYGCSYFHNSSQFPVLSSRLLSQASPWLDS